MDRDGHNHLRDLRRQLVVLNADVGENAKRYAQEFSEIREAIRKELKKLKKKEM